MQNQKKMLHTLAAPTCKCYSLGKMGKNSVNNLYLKKRKRGEGFDNL